MTLGNDRKELRKGEKLVVTISEVLHNTLLVYLEYRKTKFCGALLNTSNRRGPYGIEEQPADAYYKAYGIDPKKLEVGDESEVEKAKDVPPPKFPRTIDTRTTYAQKIDQPPPRQIYQRRRRSKRKIRMDMMDTDLALRLMTTNSSRKLLSHPPSCCCDACASVGLQKISSDKQFKGKRKLIPDAKNEDRERKDPTWLDGVKAVTKHSKRIKLEEKKEEDPKEFHDEKPSQAIKRSPVIKISYKSPGGKGRVLKIPSRLHSPPPTGKQKDQKKSAMHERARKVVIRAKTEHYKYLKEHKTDTDKNKPNGVTKTVPNSLPPELEPADDTPLSVARVSADKFASQQKNASSKSVISNPMPMPPILRNPNASKRDHLTSGEKKVMPSAKDMEVEENKKKLSSPESQKESPPTQEKRQLRSLTPQVLLQPLSEKPQDAVSPSLSSKSSESSMSSVGSWKSSTHLQQNKKDTTSLSHSISVTRCTTKEGVQWCQGDVVWAKIMGFPWWPGIVRRIIIKKGGGILEQIAIVDWFQSKTVSHIPCSALESFSGNFKKRYSKKIKGNYKRAIQEAQEAEKNMSPEVRKLIVQFET